MYLAQTILQVDTRKTYILNQANGIKVEVYKTHPGPFNPAIHRRRPSDQIIVKEQFDTIGRNAQIYEVTAAIEANLTEVK